MVLISCCVMGHFGWQLALHCFMRARVAGHVDFMPTFFLTLMKWSCVNFCCSGCRSHQSYIPDAGCPDVAPLRSQLFDPKPLGCVSSGRRAVDRNICVINE